VDPDIFTPAAPTGTPVGTLGAQAADALGLPPGCLVATGSHDQPAGALGCAVTQPGLIMDATGTVECFAAAQDEPVVNEVMLESNLQCYPAASPDTYVCLAFNYTGGSLLRWARDELGEAERAEARRAGRDVYDLLTEEMADQPTDLFVLPHMTATGTPHMDPDPIGAVVGLSVSTTRGQLLRAVIEGVSYEMKLNLDYLERAGAELERFRAIGGAARNDFWLQLKADMYGRPVEKMAVSEAASLGMAISAGVAAEVYEDAAETAAALTKPLQTFEPNPENARYYDERLEEYRELYPALKNWRESTGYRT
jgi:xylulokinase